jgi:methylated-DNA-[protein]-cysteine S-methyltransferase
VADPLHLLMDRLATPIGELIVVADAAGRLRAIDWSEFEDRLGRSLARHYGAVDLCATRDPHGFTRRMARYFAGDLAAIDGLPTATNGTPFQQAVWQGLCAIPCGTTISYAELARRVGRPTAMRAVGLANGANPIGIVVPCHRVIGADGTLTGYGGGLHRKRWLLAHESALPLQLAV